MAVLRSLIWVSVCFAVLHGCSTGKVVPTYEGEVSEAQRAFLLAPENVSVLSVNGRDVPQYLFSSNETRYALRPGANRVVFKYESLWSQAGAAKKAEVVESKPLMVDFSAKAGAEYTFQFKRPENIREAKSFVQNADINLILLTGELVAKSNLYSEAAATAQGLASIAGGAESAQGKNASVSQIEALKQLWQQLSEQERKDFLVWAFEK